jgi:hypothetical protein
VISRISNAMAITAKTSSVLPWTASMKLLLLRY